MHARAGLMVLEHQKDYDSQSAAIAAIAPKIGCIPETVRRWMRLEEANLGLRDGVSSDERSRMKELEQETRQLRQVNDILRKASAYFAPPFVHVKMHCRAAGRSSTRPLKK